MAEDKLRATKEFCEEQWESNALPALMKFVSIPNLSPNFNGDPALAMEAANHLKSFIDDNKIAGCKVEILEEKDRTPLVFVEIDGTDGSDNTVLLYCHLDKQPHLEGWTKGGPASPAVINGKLYGRGSCDDGYAIFAYITAIRALKAQNIPHARLVITIEACEESGSQDLDFYLTKLHDRIGDKVNFVVCLDSGAGDYDRMWVTSSLRGIAFGELSVSLLNEQIHSGTGSGIVPDSTRVIRILLDRLEDSLTGEIKVKELNVDIGEEQVSRCQKTAEILGNAVYTDLPLRAGAKPSNDDNTQLLLNNWWRPQLTVIATDHNELPNLPDGGNVLRLKTTLALSVRIPPGCDPQKGLEAMKECLTKDPPFGAEVTFDKPLAMAGWHGKIDSESWFGAALKKASVDYFGNEEQYLGVGGSIPIINDFEKRYGNPAVFVGGVGGPESNFHAINESLDIPAVKKITGCMVSILADHSAATK